MEFHKTAKLHHQMAQFSIVMGSFYDEDLCFFLTGGCHYYFLQQFIGYCRTWLKHGFNTLSDQVSIKLDLHPMAVVNETNAICYEATLEETFWLFCKVQGSCTGLQVVLS